ncbi:MAG: hypothetical protein KFF73_05030 [Cyclobacteriaceae bacterium]|nr:hypothetical protein [Cyclobacteriaceae bacterium]
MSKFLFYTGIFLLFAAQQPKLVKTKISENITARLPSDFFLLPPDELQGKSISYRMPIAFYTDPAREVDFSVNNSASKWQNEDIELLKEIYKSNIQNLFDNVEFMKESIESINERDYIVFEFSGTVLPGESLFKQESPDRRYYYTEYTLKGSQIFIFTFTAPFQQKEQWAGTASAIMQSIKMK